MSKSTFKRIKNLTDGTKFWIVDHCGDTLEVMKMPDGILIYSAVEIFITWNTLKKIYLGEIHL